MQSEVGRNGWRRVLVLSTYSMLVVPVAVTALAQELIPPLILFAVLFVVGLRLLGRKERAGTIMLGVLGFLFIAANAPFIAEDLAHPEAWTGFMPLMFGLPGAVGAVTASVALLRSADGGAARPFGQALLVLGVVGLVFSAVQSAGVEGEDAQEGDLELVAENVEYEPEGLTASSGAVSVHVDNKDIFRHTFVIEELDVKEEVSPSVGVRVEFSAEPGEYEFICDVPGHEDMKGTLTVE